MRRLLWFIGIFLLVAVLCVEGCRHTGMWLAREEIPPRADALVILMGYFPERVLQAADLYHEGVADKMIIVYENMGPYKVLEARGARIIRTTEQARDAAVALGVPDSCITMLPGDARSTLDEAMAVKEYLTANPGLDTIILVSSPSHMRRAYMIFREVLKNTGNKTYLGTSPSEYSSFNSHRWWRRKEDIQAVLTEWVKIVSFIIFERGTIVK